MDFLADGKGVAFGKVAETSNLLDAAWSARVRKNFTVDGTLKATGSTTVNSLNVNGKAQYTNNDFDAFVLMRNNASWGPGVGFKNNNGVLGYISMTSVNGGLKRFSADTNTSYLMLDADNTKDYIVEQASSGVWTYRKWNSGFAECWGYHTISGTNISTAWGSLFSTASPITLPSFPFTFVGGPDVHVGWESDFSAIIDGVGKRESTKAGQVYLYRPVAQTNVNGRFSIYAYGKWK